MLLSFLHYNYKNMVGMRHYSPYLYQKAARSSYSRQNLERKNSCPIMSHPVSQQQDYFQRSLSRTFFDFPAQFWIQIQALAPGSSSGF